MESQQINSLWKQTKIGSGSACYSESKIQKYLTAAAAESKTEFRLYRLHLGFLIDAEKACTARTEQFAAEPLGKHLESD